MSALQLPSTIYTTHRRMDDYGALDMRCGDLSESLLKHKFHLNDVSARVNPYTLTKIAPFNQPQSMFYGMHGQGNPITLHECQRILFNEFRDLANVFSFYGPYKHVIGQMITHMQEGNGTLFRSAYLDMALKNQILNDRSEKSSFLRIKDVLVKSIDFDKGIYPLNDKNNFMTEINQKSVLPKFDGLIDRINGLVITVHDTWATDITLRSLNVIEDSFKAVVHYRVQDHFGLDDADVLNNLYSQFRIFRIWFVLQRWVKFSFKPFITEMNATVTIEGKRNV
ncbi:DUF3289 family protein [Erwinia amylovora]